MSGYKGRRFERNQRYWQKRIFRCPECGALIPALKAKSPTQTGHIKTMYCYVCREERDFEQIE